MPLISWRKLQAGFSGSGNIKDAVGVVQHITNTTIANTPDATPFTKGIIYTTLNTDVNEGTADNGAVTPDSLAGSIFGEKIVYLKVIAETTVLTIGNAKMYFTVPDTLNGMNLVDADACVYTASSSGTPTVAIYNTTDSVDMLSTNITIDINETSSYTATTTPVIDTTNDDVTTGERIQIDVDAAGIGTTGLDIILTFRIP